GQLIDMNQMFNYPDFVNRFVDLRTKVVKESDTLQRSLPAIHSEIDALRNSASLSTDPQAAKEMTDAAAQLQEAYKHQFQLSTDFPHLGAVHVEQQSDASPPAAGRLDAVREHGSRGREEHEGRAALRPAAPKHRLVGR